MRSISFCAAVLGLAMATGAFALDPLVPEVEGWGMLRGVRVQGQFFPIKTSLRLASPGWGKIVAVEPWQTKETKASITAEKREYSGKIQLDGAPLLYKEQVTTWNGAIVIHVEATAPQAIPAEGLFFFVSIPTSQLAGGTARLTDAQDKSAPIPVTAQQENHFLGGQATGAVLSLAQTRVEIQTDPPRPFTVQDDRKWETDTYSVLVPIHVGNLVAGQKVSADVQLRVSIALDTAVAQVTVYPDRPAFMLDGFGGNMCFDPESPVTRYNMEHLNVAWGRVWAALHEWEPQNDNAGVTDMAKLAAHDRPGTRIRASMEIAQELQKRKIPYIASVWPLPKWLLLKPWDKDPFTHAAQIAPDKWDALAECAGSYLVYAKQKYGVEPDLFSFNEPDWGVMLKLTPQEQRDAIKLLGATFAKLGLKTRLLLGDVTNARNTADYVDPTLADADAMKYVKALAFHSWGGASDAQYAQWHDRAIKAQRPLLVTEAGLDAEAWRYAGVMDEYWYAAGEAKQYQQLLMHAKPQAILLWEYTQDYSIVAIDRSKTPAVLTPSKRFQFLEQLATTTPRNAHSLEVTSSREDLLATAFRGNDGKLTMHLMNDGAARDVEITGLPPGSFTASVTDSTRNAAQHTAPTRANGTVRVKLPAWSLVTLRQG